VLRVIKVTVHNLQQQQQQQVQQRRKTQGLGAWVSVKGEQGMGSMEYACRRLCKHVNFARSAVGTLRPGAQQDSL
jgi:hypothetical protein